LERLEFQGICLEEVGLIRIIDAANKTSTLEKLDIGILTDNALQLLAQRISENKFLADLTFTETSDH
jgi:hypothetical protein